MKTATLIVLVALFAPATKLLAQVPQFNSYTPATAVLFLDFDGDVVSGTNWNMDGPIYCGPSNLNAAQVTEIYNRIAEDYRPFNINVTTDSAVYDAAPIDRRMRVVFTITSDWYGVAGGVAYTNSFTWGNNTPCFVFTALHKYNVKNISEAASHEAGHTLGLRHQAMYDSSCNKITDYNSGTGSGIAGWAPIMGIGYYRNNTTWHNGPNPYGCNNEQDDLALITSEHNGFGYRPDDDTATDFTAAIRLNADTNRLVANGLISTNTDTDLFGFTMPAKGPLMLSVHPYSIAPNDEGSNLDVEVRLYGKDQTLLNTYNPGTVLSVMIDTTLASGTYYLAVSGARNPFSSGYASLGAYAITGTVPKAVHLAPDAIQLRGRVTGNAHSLNWSIKADETVTTQVLERLENGTSFVPAATPFPDARTFTFPAAKEAQYRLNVTFENGRQYYSDTILLHNAITAVKPQLHTNLIHSNSLQVTSPAAYQYVITNVSGQRISNGQIKEGITTINMGILKSGLYVISFENNEQRVVQKFIRQ